MLICYGVTILKKIKNDYDQDKKYSFIKVLLLSISPSYIKILLIHYFVTYLHGC